MKKRLLVILVCLILFSAAALATSRTVATPASRRGSRDDFCLDPETSRHPPHAAPATTARRSATTGQ